MHPQDNLSLFDVAVEQRPDPFLYEERARSLGFRLVAGVDEAGRGPLAGPVVAAAVILQPGRPMNGVTDSKAMTEKARERAFILICEQAAALGIGVVPASYIDEHDILTASLEAMRIAVSFLDPSPEFLLVDGNHQVPVRLSQKCLKKGDRLSRSISAASVIAKVYRDRIMCSCDKSFPGYGFTRHKGYGTRRHLSALKELGPCRIHRKTFRGVVAPTVET
ncbi:MAG: ribonuclease HII [Desulfobacteraceae bacterium]